MVEYSVVVKDVLEVVRNDATTSNKWLKVGAEVAGFFQSKDKLIEIKAQFCADAILPALDKKYTQALAIDLPRKGTKEYNALDKSGLDKWEAVNQAKKDARAIVATYFSRVIKYAFPSEKAEPIARSLKTRACEELTALIKAVEKAENPGFDPVAILKHLNAALAVAAK